MDAVYMHRRELVAKHGRALLKGMDFIVSLSCSMAYNEQLYAYLLLRDSPFFHHKIKKLANDCDRLSVIKRKGMILAGDKHKFFEDFIEAAIDVAEQDVRKCKDAIFKFFAYKNMEHPQLLAQMEVARTLLVISKGVFDEYIKIMYNATGIDATKKYDTFDCSPILSRWDELCKDLFESCNKTKCSLVDGTEEIDKTARLIVKKLMKWEYFDKSIAIALDENKEICEELKKIMK